MTSKLPVFIASTLGAMLPSTKASEGDLNVGFTNIDAFIQRGIRKSATNIPQLYQQEVISNRVRRRGVKIK